MYGNVAQSQVGAVDKIKRLAVIARYLLAQFRNTVREGRSFDPDLLHAHWAIPTGTSAVWAAHRLNIPSVITMHGGDVYVNPVQGYDFPTRWYVRPPLRYTLKRAQALTAITEDCRQHALRAGAPSNHIHVIMNGADLKRFSPSNDGELRNGDAIFGRQMIFACRQLIPRKGIRFLIQAFARLKPHFPDTTLVIAGDGFEKPELEQMAKDLRIADSTIFLGWVENSELPRYFRAAAVTVIPSLEEGFGIPAAEAMGCQVPVVASDAGGLPEVVEDGVTGFVVPKGSVDALAYAIKKLLVNETLRIQMGKAGRKRALRLFDWNRTARHFEILYRTILADSRRVR
jgi:glycosyltransferase involved in cell wall biosynthesis